MSWLRLEAAYFQNPTVIRAGWEGSIVFIAAITMSKLLGWDGALPRDEFVPSVIRRHLGADDTLDIQKGLETCIAVGLLTEDDTHLMIAKWRKFQPDPGSRDRQRKSRSSRAVTVTNRDDRLSRTTGRDGTVRDETKNPLTPLEGGNGSPSASGDGEALRPRDRERYARTLEYVIRNGSDHPKTPIGRQKALARTRRAEHREGKASDDTIRAALAVDYQWVTRPRLASFEKEGSS